MHKISNMCNRRWFHRAGWLLRNKVWVLVWPFCLLWGWGVLAMVGVRLPGWVLWLPRRSLLPPVPMPTMQWQRLKRERTQEFSKTLGWRWGTGQQATTTTQKKGKRWDQCIANFDSRRHTTHCVGLVEIDGWGLRHSQCRNPKLFHGTTMLGEWWGWPVEFDHEWGCYCKYEGGQTALIGISVGGLDHHPLKSWTIGDSVRCVVQFLDIATAHWSRRCWIGCFETQLFFRFVSGGACKNEKE